MMQIPPVQPQQCCQCCQSPAQPSYNAVKIDIHNPSVNAPAAQSPVYGIPSASVYEMPKQSAFVNK